MLLRTSHVPWSACPCVLGTRVSPAKTVEPIEVPFKGTDSCIRLHKRICWRQQANTIKQSVSGGGVALRQSTRLIIPPYITPSSETHSTPAYSHLNRLVHQSMFRILRPQYRKQSIVMRMSVCLYVRTRADQETSPNFLSMLPMAMARSTSGSVAQTDCVHCWVEIHVAKVLILICIIKCQPLPRS